MRMVSILVKIAYTFFVFISRGANDFSVRSVEEGFILYIMLAHVNLGFTAKVRSLIM